MDEIKIYWTNTALLQRNLIFEYWNNRNNSKTYSKKLNLEIRERLKQLIDNPEIGKPSDYKNFRAISLGYYSIIYKLSDNIIYITAFWDNRQEPSKLLLQLKKRL